MKNAARFRYSLPAGIRETFGFAALLLKTVGLGLACLLVEKSNLCAQSIIQPAPDEPLPPPVLRKHAAPPPASHLPAPLESPYRIGPVVLNPRLSYRHLSADGLPAVDGRRIASEIRTVAPGLLIDLGENWSFDYNPTWVAYTARAMADTTDHAARLSGALTVDNWFFEFVQSYSKSNPALIETARQTDQKTWATTLGSVYRHSQKLQVELSGSLNERYTSVAPDLKTWAGRVALNYLLTQQFSLNVGPEFSYTEVANEPDYYGESIMAQINWHPTDKLTFGIGSGVEYTHSNSTSGVDLSNPLLNLSVGYQPFETTTLGASVSRTVSPSYFRAQTTESLSWNLNLSQRLLGKIYLGANYSRQESDYVSLQNSVVAGRTDKIEAYGFRLSTRLLQRLSVSFVFQKSMNTSSLAAFSFSSNQYGIELGYGY